MACQEMKGIICTLVWAVTHEHECVRETGAVYHLTHLNLPVLTSVSAPVRDSDTQPSIHLPPPHCVTVSGFRAGVLKAISLQPNRQGAAVRSTLAF